MTYTIKHLFHIDTSKTYVYNALTTLEGLSSWWTVETNGNPSAVDNTVSFNFGTIQGPTMKILELIPDQKVTWECIESAHGWVGHKLTFLLDENDDKIRLRFTHEGWDTQDDFYAICNFSWGRYMESLRQHCQYDLGAPYGSKNYK